MKHPNREEWIPFLYGEMQPQARQELTRHLAECSECAHELARWRKSLRHLDRWQAPPVVTPHSDRWFPGFKWALAALFVLGLGLLLGRYLVRPQAQELRLAVETSVRNSLRSEMHQALEQLALDTSNQLASAEIRLADASTLENRKLWQAFLQVLNTARSEDGQALQTALNEYQQQHRAELVALRKDLETLASTADEQLRQARTRLFQLAANAVSEQ